MQRINDEKPCTHNTLIYRLDMEDDEDAEWGIVEKCTICCEYKRIDFNKFEALQSFLSSQGTILKEFYYYLLNKELKTSEVK